MGGEQLEKAREKGISDVAKNSEIEKLRGILKGKQEVIEKLKRENEEIQNEYFS